MVFSNIIQKYYIGLEDKLKTQYDLIFIDGPFGFDTEIARTNIIKMAEKKLIAEGGTIFLYDYQRTGEINLVKKLNEIIDFDLSIPDTIYPFAILENIKYK